MKKSAIALFFAAFLSISAFAQNVQEGVGHFYAERYQSAKAAFERMVAANPNNLEAIYWLGQTHIAANNVAAAKSLYEKSLAANSNPPLILAGAGHVDLLEGRTNEARQRFESAITASRGKKGDDPAVVNALARATIDAKGGDITYAIGRLTALAQSSPNHAETYLNLGNAYWKAHNGGQAIQNFRKAAQLNPSLAAASYYRTARLFRTQNNWPVVVENLNEAIKADPRFAPAYELMYTNSIMNKQYAEAEQWANKYIANSDPNPENDVLKIQTLVVQEKYADALSALNGIISQTGNNATSRVYRLMTVTQLGLKDTLAACTASNQFFAKAKEDDIVGNDYILHASACAKGDPAMIREDVLKAVQMDSVLSRQVSMLNEAIQNAQTNNQKVLQAELSRISYELRGTQARPSELFQIGLNYFLGGSYMKADTMFTAYSAAFPDSIYGHYWGAQALTRIDSNMALGLAVPKYERTIQIAETDKVRFKGPGLQSSSALAAYYNNVKSDRENAIKYLRKGLEFDPENAQLKNFLEALTKPATRPPAAKPAAKPATGTKGTAQKTTASTTPAKGKAPAPKKKS